MEKLAHTMSDGVTLMTTRYPASGKPRMGMLHVHGISEHSGRYTALWNQVAQRGYPVVAYDQRGHGLSGGERAIVDWPRMVQDIKEMLLAEADFLGPHHVLLGHSMGGGQVAYGIITHQITADAVILSSPALGIGPEFPPAKQLAARLVGALAPKLTLLRKGRSTTLSSIDAEVDKYDQDPLVNHVSAVSSLAHIFNPARETMARAAEWTLPTLLVYGLQDLPCSPQAMAKFYETISSPIKARHVEPEGRHELLFDTCSSKVLDIILHWMDERWEQIEKS